MNGMDEDMKSLSLEEAIAILSDMKIDIPVPKAAVTQRKRNVALDMAISALNRSEVPNSSDSIHRQEALDAVTDELDMIDHVPQWVFDRLEKRLKQLPSAQPGWTYIEEALPETIINEHTHDYQEYNCLCDFGDNGFDVRTYKFGNGHFWNGGGIVDKYVTAWQPLPEIPDALKPKPWEGEQDES